MRILVTNDDGVFAEGLWALARSLQAVGRVHIVAPDRDQSGVGTAKTLLTVVRTHEVTSLINGIPTYAVQGTPTDSVILATESLFSEPFDLLVSGINPGANMGIDLFSSGTFAAALHGLTRGIPSMAVSVSSLTEVRYDVAAQVAQALASQLLKHPLSVPYCLNVNLPNLKTSDIKGVKVTSLAPESWSQGVEKGHDGRRTHYWIKHNKPPPAKPPKGTDVWAILNGYVSITPVDPLAVNGISPDSLNNLTKAATSIFSLPNTDKESPDFRSNGGSV